MTENTEARERVLNMAEQLFMERGYKAVSMSDLAHVLGMRKASLYHHASAGKEALYVEVMARTLARYQRGLQDAIEAAQPLFEARLQAAADWLLAHPSLHYERMMQSDMPELSPENKALLTRLTYQALLSPLTALFMPEMETRGLEKGKATYIAGAFLSVIEGIHNLPTDFAPAALRPQMASFLIEVLFKPFGTYRKSELE